MSGLWVRISAMDVGGLHVYGDAGYLVSKGIESHVKKAKTGPVGEIVDHWNHVCESSSSM